MGSNPVNNIDPDGGGIEDGGWGAIIGAGIGFVSSYIIARKKGASVGSSLAWGFLGAGLGAGIGYGIDAEGPQWLNIKAFYKGLFGGSGFVNASTKPLNLPGQWAHVVVPNIWGSGCGSSNGIGILPTIIKTVIEDIPIQTRIRIQPQIQLDRSTRQIPPIRTPSVNPCPCFNIQTRNPPEDIPFNFEANSPEGYSYTDSGISDEQFNVVRTFTTGLRGMMMPGDEILNATLWHRSNFSGNGLPMDNIPTIADKSRSNVTLGGSTFSVGQASVSYNPITGRRVDGPWRDGLALRPVIGGGRTIFQHYGSQTNLMRNLLRVRFPGVAIRGETRWTRSTPARYQFVGAIRRPGNIIMRTICLCGN